MIAVYLLLLCAGGAVDPALERLVQAEAHAHRLNVEIVKAIITVESAWDSEAVSVKNARGLMQLLPATMAAVGGDPDRAFDPQENVHFGLVFIERLIDRYGDSAPPVLGAYFSGKPNVDRGDVKQYVKKVYDAYACGIR